jgi:hypothetical protein
MRGIKILGESVEFAWVEKGKRARIIVPLQEGRVVEHGGWRVRRRFWSCGTGDVIERQLISV